MFLYDSEEEIRANYQGIYHNQKLNQKENVVEYNEIKVRLQSRLGLYGVVIETDQQKNISKIIFSPNKDAIKIINNSIISDYVWDISKWTIRFDVLLSFEKNQEETSWILHLQS